jgi:predicted nucleic acid-binding OB-fold protein
MWGWIMAWSFDDQQLVRRNRLVIAGVLIAIILLDVGVIVYRKIDHAEYVVEYQPMNFVVHFDPNSAQVDELEVLPGLNRNLAQAIVDYREESQRYYPDRTVFMQAADLMQVKGISEKTITQAEKFLIFPQKATPEKDGN